MGTIAPQITRLTIVYSTVYSGADQRKRQSSASLVFMRGINRWPVNSPHKGPVTRKMLPFDDVIMFMNENLCILIWISLKYVPKGSIENKSAMVQVIVCRRTGDNRYLNQCLPSSPTHMCMIRERWANLVISCQKSLSHTAGFLCIICFVSGFIFHCDA